MVEILKTPPKVTVDVYCTGKGNGNEGCGAHLRFGREELRYFPELEKMFNIVPEAVVAKCPCCGMTTDLDRENWPHDPRGLIKWSKNWVSMPLDED